MKVSKFGKIIKYLWIILPIIAILSICFISIQPSMGMKVLRYSILKSSTIVCLGITSIIAGIHALSNSGQAWDNYGRPRQESLEELYEKRGDHTGLLGVAVFIGGIILTIYGATHVVSDIRDVQNGPVRITLESTKIGNIKQVEAGKEVSVYDLYGSAGGEVFKFRIDAGEADENLMRRINYLSPEITVIYYPETKAIVQIQILFEENDKVVLPYGERAYDSKSLEKLPIGQNEDMLDEEEYKEYTQKVNQPTPAPTSSIFVSMRQEYSEVELEELGLTEISIGDNYKEVSKKLMSLPEGECYKSALLDAVLYNEYFQKLKGVISEYGITGTQGCDILYKDDIELILIYNTETYAIEAVYARRCLIRGD